MVFIDVPKKKNNPEAERIPQIPIETSIREKIGRVISPDNLQEVPEAIGRIVRDRESFSDGIRAERNACVFNLGTSAKVGAAYINQLADELFEANRGAR